VALESDGPPELVDNDVDGVAEMGAGLLVDDDNDKHDMEHAGDAFEDTTEQAYYEFEPPATSTPQQLLRDHEQCCHFVSLTPLFDRYDGRMNDLEAENKTLRRTVDRLVAQATLVQEFGISRGGRTSNYNDDDLTHLFMEIERLRTDVFHLTTTTNERYLQQNTMLVHETARTNEDIALLRGGFNSIRQQLHFLLNARRAAAEAPGPAVHVKL
jgi:hypothetical protein